MLILNSLKEVLLDLLPSPSLEEPVILPMYATEPALLKISNSTWAGLGICELTGNYNQLTLRTVTTEGGGLSYKEIAEALLGAGIDRLALPANIGNDQTLDNLTEFLLDYTERAPGTNPNLEEIANTWNVLKDLNRTLIVTNQLTGTQITSKTALEAIASSFNPQLHLRFRTPTETPGAPRPLNYRDLKRVSEGLPKGVLLYPFTDGTVGWFTLEP
jgi:hypothetical protein